MNGDQTTAARGFFENFNIFIQMVTIYLEVKYQAKDNS